MSNREIADTIARGICRDILGVKVPEPKSAARPCVSCNRPIEPDWAIHCAACYLAIRTDRDALANRLARIQKIAEGVLTRVSGEKPHHSLATDDSRGAGYPAIVFCRDCGKSGADLTTPCNK